MSDPAPDPIVRLVGVYDADGGLVGELRYIIGHVFHRAECALCDITHSWRGAKSEWKQCATALPVPIEVHHRNEIDETLLRFIDRRLPCVVGIRKSGEYEFLLGRDHLEQCGANVNAFDEMIRSTLESH
jgi:hypothetical protein